MKACDICTGIEKIATFRVSPSTRPDGQGSTKMIGSVDLCVSCADSTKVKGIVQTVYERSSGMG